MSTADDQPTVQGHCLCGKVRFTARGPLRPVVACHCDECRRFTSSQWNATAAYRDNLSIEGEENLRWHAFTEYTRRGFCGTCGSSLFFDPIPRDYIAIGMGALEKPTGLELAVHIWAQEAGDYLTLCDDLPKLNNSNHGLTM